MEHEVFVSFGASVDPWTHAEKLHRHNYLLKCIFWVDKCIYLCMYACMYVYVCVYVCVCVCVCLFI